MATLKLITSFGHVNSSVIFLILSAQITGMHAASKRRYKILLKIFEKFEIILVPKINQTSNVSCVEPFQDGHYLYCCDMIVEELDSQFPQRGHRTCLTVSLAERTSGAILRCPSLVAKVLHKSDRGGPRSRLPAVSEVWPTQVHHSCWHHFLQACRLSRGPFVTFVGRYPAK